MKNSIFDSLFSSEPCVFFSKIRLPLKIYHFMLYIVENRGLGQLSDDVGFIPNLYFMVFGTLIYARMPVYAYAYMKHVHAELEHACAYACIRTHTLGFLWFLFSKKSLFSPKKSYIFPKHFLKSISIRLGPKPTLGFRIPTLLGNGGSSCKGYKM